MALTKFSSVLLFILVNVELAIGDLEYFTELGPTPLSNFDGLRSQSIFHWTNDYDRSSFFVNLKINRNQTGNGLQTKCPDKLVHVIARDNAIPVANPLGTSSPTSTLDGSRGLLHSSNFSMPSCNSTAEWLFNFSVASQRQGSGHVFVSVFLTDDSDQSIDLSGLSKGCSFFADVLVYHDTAALAGLPPATRDGVSDVVWLKRQKWNLFDVQYVATHSGLNVTRGANKTVGWHVYPLTDSGGSLYVHLKALTSDGGNTTTTTSTAANEHISVFVCLSNSLTENRSCGGGHSWWIESFNGTKEWFVPYPVAGEWFMRVHFDDGAADVIELHLDVRIVSCVESCHQERSQGECRLYQHDEVLFSACNCKAGWRGIACTDGAEALDYTEQLLRTLLLTTSNLMFLPCMLLAASRRFYAESLVYFYVFFMSSFYHACDQPGVVVYCLLPYDTLQFCDFFASIAAIWFTLVLVARTDFPKVDSWLASAGFLVIATLVSYDRFSLWSFTVPLLLAMAVVLASWVRRCRSSGAMYPTKKVALYSLVPGLVFAAGGFTMYAFVETKDNYFYTHSVWHVCMAISVLFVMPTGATAGKQEDSEYNVEINYAAVDDISMSTSRINTNNNNQSYLPRSVP